MGPRKEDSTDMDVWKAGAKVELVNCIGVWLTMQWIIQSDNALGLPQVNLIEV